MENIFIEKIKELEQENNQLKENILTIQGKRMKETVMFANKCKTLDKQLAIMEKSLELACIKLAKLELRENKDIVDSIKDSFIELAKEIVKSNENRG